MKKYLPLIAVIAFIFNGCQKTDTNTPIVITPEISIQNISYPAFEKSTWNQVVGGNLVMEFGLKDAKDSITTRIKDSVDIKNIATYTKTLDKGKYDINISAGNPSAVADIFLRFNGQIKSYSVDTKEAVSLTVNTNDGLITIGKSFIKNGDIPVFKADGDTKEYKMGLNSGFYYLYIKGGVKGNVSFVASANNQSVTKSLTIASLKQYNMEVVVNKGPLQVVFAPFLYNQVGVNSATLITLNLYPDSYVNYTTYFVATDENGNILGEVKYIKGTTTFKLSSVIPYEKERFNFYEIKISDRADTAPGITGYLQIKKGSTYTYKPNLYSYESRINLHFKNATAFDKLLVSTNYGGYTANSSDNISNIEKATLAYTPGTKLWVQMLKGNQYIYNFFDIPNGAANLDIDLNDLTKTSVKKTILVPGATYLNVSVNARIDNTSNLKSYNLQGASTQQGGTVDVYYPQEAFTDYNTIMYYRIGDLNYVNSKVATSIPGSPDALNASFNSASLGSNLADFKPSFTGDFDFYFANFLPASDPSPDAYMSVSLYSPSSVNYTNIKLPDFSKYVNKPVNLSKLKLTRLGLYQVDGFNETNPAYMFNQPFTNWRSVSR